MDSQILSSSLLVEKYNYNNNTFSKTFSFENPTLSLIYDGGAQLTVSTGHLLLEESKYNNTFSKTFSFENPTLSLIYDGGANPNIASSKILFETLNNNTFSKTFSFENPTISLISILDSPSISRASLLIQNNTNKYIEIIDINKNSAYVYKPS